MGTRNLTAVVMNNEFKVAQYGQWDGYPSGQGATICDFIQNKMNEKKFREALLKCKFIGSRAIRNRWIKCGAKPDNDFVSIDIADKFKEKYPALSRDTGAKVLELIQSGKAKELQNSLAFAGDSLFCEYAYILDLDSEVLEVYKGFNQEKVKGRFANMEGLEQQKGYNPVTLLKRYNFKEATIEAMTALEEELNRDD